MSEAASILRRRTLIILGAAAAVSALLGAGSFMAPAQDMPRTEVGQLVLPAFESKAGLITLVMVTTEEESYHLVFGDSVEFEEGQVTMSSPIGRALVGKAVGELVMLKLPTVTRRLEIIDLKTIHVPAA